MSVIEIIFHMLFTIISSIITTTRILIKDFFEIIRIIISFDSNPVTKIILFSFIFLMGYAMLKLFKGQIIILFISLLLFFILFLILFI